MFKMMMTMAFVLAGCSVSAQQPAYTKEQVQQAIQRGTNGEFETVVASCYAYRGGLRLLEDNDERGVFWVFSSHPLLRIISLADDAKDKFLPSPAPDDEEVVDILQNDVFAVYAFPVGRGRLPSAEINHMVIRPRGDRDGNHVVQPLAIETNSKEAPTEHPYFVDKMIGDLNIDPGRREALATFDRDAVIAISQDVDVEVIIIIAGEQYMCNLDDTRILRGYGLTDRLPGR